MNEFILLGAGFLAAFIGTMSGGGAGLIALFALLSFGMPLNSAIATNKMGDLGFFFPALRNLVRAKLINKRALPPIILINLLGVTIGTLLIAKLNEQILTAIVTTVLILLILASFVRKDDALKDRPIKRYWSVIYFGTSVSSGALGAGTGILSTMTLIYFRGFTALKAMAHSFYANLFGSSLSAAILLFSGLINYRFAFFLFIGNVIGAHFGSKIAIKQGNGFVRYMITTLAICVVAQLLLFR